MTPEKFGRYEVQAEIGDGAMGRVYRGFDPLARRMVAIKTIKSELLTKNASEEYVRRFQREAQAAGRLSHPHIVTIFDVGENYFVMEFLEGETLYALLARQGRLGLHAALGIIDPVADAIDYAHRNGIIHRDIKPANIMVMSDGRAKLMDFGVVHIDSTAMTAAGQFLGSPLYMAPEQIASGEVTGKTDVFALAAVAYEMVTGKRAFEGVSITSIIYRVMNEAPAPPRQWNLELPPHYDDVFAKALTKDPAARYETASEFAAALDLKDFDESLSSAFPVPIPATAAGAASRIGGETQDLRQLATPLPPPAASKPAPSPSGPGAAVARLAVVALLIAVAALFWVRRTPNEPPRPKATPPLGIESDPVGASVFVDDRDMGVTPMFLPGLSLGEHVVRVTRNGFSSGQLSIAVTPEGIPPLRFVLESLTAPVRIASEPAGAAVTLDGRGLGATPLDAIAVSPGKHDVTLEHAGFRAWRSSFEATAGKPVELWAALDRAAEKTARKTTATPAPTPTPVVHEGDLVDLDSEVTPPKKISGKTAIYPAGAMNKHLEGKVTVELIVDEKGEPTDLRVVESADEVLDKPVMDAIRNWRYEPATKNGVKVKVRIREWQRFEIRAPK
jgi:eukaryotic-like serine/threonine-protein kinase